MSGEEHLINFLSNLAKGSDASEKVTLGIMGLLGIGIIYPTQYNLYLFIVFILFAAIHLLNLVFKPILPHIITKPERLCPDCNRPLEPIEFYCQKCKRNF